NPQSEVDGWRIIVACDGKLSTRGWKVGRWMTNRKSSRNSREATPNASVASCLCTARGLPAFGEPRHRCHSIQRVPGAQFPKGDGMRATVGFELTCTADWRFAR